MWQKRSSPEMGYDARSSLDDLNGRDADLLRQKYQRERDKRLHGNRESITELTGDLRRYLDDTYTPPAARPSIAENADEATDVLVVGAGLGGLIIAAELRKKHIDRIRLIDAAGDVGGVWYWNRYPGVRCDVESLIYMPLLEELDYIPTERYAKGSEIRQHAQSIARHYGLYADALFQTTVTGMKWDNADAQWEVSTDRGDKLRARVVVLAVGPLDRPRLPAIPGIETFAGPTFHTSRWDYRVTGGSPDSDPDQLADKVVGLIGTGATALQCVPVLGRVAKKLYVFQRTPSTVAVRDNRPVARDAFTHEEPGWQARRRRNFTTLLYGGSVDADLVDDSWTHVWREIAVNPRFRGLAADELEHEKEMADFRQMEALRSRIDELVDDPDTAERLKPYYRYLCKRPGFHDEYLQTFNRPNVELVDTNGHGIEQVYDQGVVVNGEKILVDCLVFATGFETNAPLTERIGFDVIGSSGTRLSEKWKDGLRTLHGFMTAGYPNLLFQPAQDTQAVQTVNLVDAMCESAEHFAYVIDSTLRRGAAWFDVEPSAEEDWVRTIVEEAPDNSHFLQECTPGRKNNEGHPDVQPLGNKNYGKGPLEFWEILATFRETGLLGLRFGDRL